MCNLAYNTTIINVTYNGNSQVTVFSGQSQKIAAHDLTFLYMAGGATQASQAMA